MISIFAYLQRYLLEIVSVCADSTTVAKFQAFCGIEYSESEQPNGKNIEIHTTGNGNYVDEHSNGKNTENQFVTNGNHYNNTAKVRNRANGFVTTESTKPSEHDQKLLYSTDSRVRIRMKFLYFLFRFGTSLGNEIFYITFFPFCIWNFDVYTTSRACIFWCLYMYIGQVAKEVFKLPRPASPPVVRMESHLDQEYGLPSTHAMAGTGIPLTMLYLIGTKYEVNAQAQGHDYMC